jgi:UDP-N-acetylmuramate--alanine ligase
MTGHATLLLGRVKRIHFVGVGGSGMSGIAELLADLGYIVTGSDQKRSTVTDRLEALHGVTVHEGHAEAHIGEAEIVVVSSALQAGNPEVGEARRREIPVLARAEMLAELLRVRKGIAVAGSHGKTTTTSMIAVVLERAGLDPTVVVGGRLLAFGGGARLGRGNHMVVEADESDRSFLSLRPVISVMTNIDREHMENYSGFADLQKAFVTFANSTPVDGAVVACADDRGLAGVLPLVRRRVVTYSLENPTAEFVGTNIEVGSTGSRCAVVRRRGAAVKSLGTLRVSVPGRHNLLNAMAAVAVVDLVSVDFTTAAEALETFSGVARRFERCGEADGVQVVDDYGHHPTELAAVLEAARVALGRRLVVAFQPHRYTRTAQLLDEFGPALAGADEIVLTDIYAAGEEPISGVTAERLAEAVRLGSGRPVHLVPELDDVVPALVDLARPGDAVITLGAGSIADVPARLLVALAERTHREQRT